MTGWCRAITSLTGSAFLCGALFLAGGCSHRPEARAPEALTAEAALPGIPNAPLFVYAEDAARSTPGINSVALLETGRDALLSRIHLIRAARRELSLQALIWANDECGRLIMYELIQAARRGVRVRFLIDHLASERHIELATFLAYAHPNLEIKLFNPVSGLFSQPKAKPFFLETLYALIFKFNRFNHRMHNKTFIVDDQVAITGGRNYQNAYFDQARGMNYKDRDILVVGPVVTDIAASFEDYWDSKYSISLNQLVDVQDQLRRGAIEELATREQFELNGLLKQVNEDLSVPGEVSGYAESLQPVASASFVADSPRKRDRLLVWFGGDSAITRRLAEVVSGAERSVYIQTPYLVLTSSAIALFKKLRQDHRDIDIRVSTNSLAATDSWHVYAMSFKQKQTYLQTLGFKIYEFKPLPADMPVFMPGLDRLRTWRASREQSDSDVDQQDLLSGQEPYLCLHSKSLVVDDEVAFVGSYNLDPRSENLNTEAGLFIRDRAFARRLKAYIKDDMAAENSWVVARKKMVLGLDYPNALLAKLSDILPVVDVWPFRFATSYELIEGEPAVDADHPAFYDRFRDVGNFPGNGAGGFGKELGVIGTKSFLGFVKPLL